MSASPSPTAAAAVAASPDGIGCQGELRIHASLLQAQGAPTLRTCTAAACTAIAAAIAGDVGPGAVKPGGVLRQGLELLVHCQLDGTMRHLGQKANSRSIQLELHLSRAHPVTVTAGWNIKLWGT